MSHVRLHCSNGILHGLGRKTWKRTFIYHLLVSGDTWHWYAKKIQIQGDKTRLCFLFQPKPKHFLNISKATRSFAYCMSFSTKPNLEQFPMQWIGLSLHLYIHGKIEELLAWVLMMREISRRLMDRMHFKWYTGCFYQLSQTNLTFGREVST